MSRGTPEEKHARWLALKADPARWAAYQRQARARLERQHAAFKPPPGYVAPRSKWVVAVGRELGFGLRVPTFSSNWRTVMRPEEIAAVEAEIERRRAADEPVITPRRVALTPALERRIAETAEAWLADPRNIYPRHEAYSRARRAYLDEE